jgi:hypothetical protein
MEASTMKAAPVETAAMETTAATLRVTEVGRDEKNG